MLATTFEILLTGLVLLGIVYEDKLIKFENTAADWAAKQCAKVIIIHRKEMKQ